MSAAAHQYEGARTDGDYSPRSVYHYLRPDGQTLVAHNPASYAIGASIPLSQSTPKSSLLLGSWARRVRGR